MEPGSTQVPGRAPDNGWACAGHVPCSASRGLRFPEAGVTGQLLWMLGTERWARFMHVYTYMYLLWHGCGVRGEHCGARVSFHHGDPAMELRLQSAAGSFPC